MATQAQITAVQQLYVSYLGRAADKAGLEFWSNAIANGTSTIESVATGLTLANEYTTKYAGLSNDALVDAVYTNVLGRTADAAGKAFWVSAFANGTVKADTFVSSLIQSLGAQDQATINNKTFVAQTYTDTVGDAYTPAGGAAVLVGVDSTAASVNTALAAIANGTLEGQVPGAAQITALAAAQTAQTTFETTNKATTDALVAKIAAEATAAGLTDGDTLNDDLDANSTYQDKVDAALADAQAIRDKVAPGVTTTILATDASDKAGTTTKAYAALSATVAANAPAGTLSEKAQADAYVAAIAAEATAKTAAASDVDYAAVLAGLGADTTASAGLGANSAAQVYSNYVNGTATERTAIDTAFKDSAYYSTFKATVVKDAAYADAIKATAAAKGALDSGTSAASTVDLHSAAATKVTVNVAADTKIGSDAANAYVNALTAKTAADTLLADAQKADASLVAAQAASDAYDVATKAVADAKTAVDAINVAGKVAVHDLDVSVTGTAAVKDTFYFGSKVDAADDHVIAANNFGSGDSIVLGNSFTYNSGALSTGDNNKAEFFLVQKGADTLVVIETSNFGSSTTTHTATGDAALTSADSPNAAIITLTGVNVADLTVNNGIISHVA